MATATATATTSALQGDLEKGRVEAAYARMTNYVRDITYKVIPFCMGFLIVLSIGAILATTLHFHEPIPSKDIIVVSIMLLVFFILFCFGGMLLYHRKHYPPLTKGPNAPDRPPPKNKTWKDRASVIGTLTIGNFKLGKIHHHHHEAELGANPQGLPNHPTELPSSASAYGQRDSGRAYNAHSSNMTRSEALPGYGMKNRDQLKQLNQKPLQRVPVQGGHQPNPHRNSFTPSQGTIPEAPEENWQNYSLTSRKSNTRNKHTPDMNENGVSPLSRNSNPYRGFHYSPYSPEAQMTGANRKTRAQDDSPKSSQSLQVPGAETRRTSRDYPIPALQPQPQVVHLNPGNTEPLANLVRIPGNINDRALDEALRNNHLYILDNQLSTLDDKLKESRCECRCECIHHYAKKSKSQAHESKIKEIPIHIDTPRELDIVKVAKVQERRSMGDLIDENRKPKTHQSSTCRGPRAKSRWHDTSERERIPSPRRKENCSPIINNYKEFFDKHPYTGLPLPPRKSQHPPLNRRDPEPLRNEEDWHRSRHSIPPKHHQSVKEAKERSLNRSWGKQQIPQNRGRRANSMTEGYLYGQNYLRSKEDGWFGIRPRVGYTDNYLWRTPWVPPRVSSRAFTDVYGIASQTTPAESSSSISSNFRQHE